MTNTTEQIVKHHCLKKCSEVDMTYPLGIDNPIIIKGVIGSHKWALYWRDDMTKIATFNSEHQAYQARRSLLDNYDS